MVDRPAFTDVAANLFRDYNTIGNPSSGIFNPVKADLRVYFGETEDFLNDLYDKAPSYLTNVAGTANAQTADATPAVDALATGQVYIYAPSLTNTAVGPTLAINGLTAKTIADRDGNDLPIGGQIGSRTYVLVYDGTKLRQVGNGWDGIYFKALDADDTGGQNVNTAQPWFPTAGGIILPVGSWLFDSMLWISRSAGTTSHTTGIGFAGSATYSIVWDAAVNTGDVATIATPAKISQAAATNLQIKAASTSATEQIVMRVMGYLKVTVTGTFIPQFTYSAAPGGTPTIKAGSFIRLWPRAGGLTSIGAWA